MNDALTPYLIRQAYRLGLFPMGNEAGAVGWYEPRRRALFPIEGIHVSRSLAKLRRRSRVHWVDGGEPQEPADPTFEVTLDKAFHRVMESCLRPQENWITPEIIQAFTEVHRQGWAHSCEVWSGEELVGGAYGVAVGGCFSAESMFHRQANASKIALWAMVEQCRRLGFAIFDAQIMNPHLRSLGAFEIPQREYLSLLGKVEGIETAWSSNRHG